MSKKYIHYGHKKFSKEVFIPIRNRKYFNKPIGGMWASPLDAEFGWKQWNSSEQFRECDENNCFVFELKSEARVYHIFNVEDYKKMPRVTNTGCLGTMFEPQPDFEELIKQGYDAVELHLSNDRQLYWELYGWDCDSILIMNPGIVVSINKENDNG